MKPAVSVIIPVYRAERYMERCARGLFGQTLDDVEYIFVDDCTPDRSFDVLRSVLDEYPRRQSQVRIIRHDTNRGVAEARTSGMKVAAGEYMTHHDPDDHVPADAYASMYRRAVETGADIVTGLIISELARGGGNGAIYSVAAV